MNNQQYHADTSRISKSGLDWVHKSPAHFYAKYLDPNRPKKEPDPKKRSALKEGQLIHTVVFEPHKVTQEYAIIPPGLGTTNNDKEKLARFYLQHPGKTFVTQENFETALKIKAAVEEHPIALTLIKGGKFEEVVHWTQPDLGVKCKSRFDCRSIIDAGSFIVDLKTCEDASPEGFGKSVFNYRYHVQGAFYIDAYEAKYGTRPDKFIFIAVEKQAPYACKLHYLTQEQYEMGKREYMEDLAAYKEAIETGFFKGYDTEVSPVIMPAWTYKKSA